jgi:hypothetical protein
VETVQTNQRFWVNFRGLEDYMDPRVRTLLQEAGLRVQQPIRITYSAKEPICEVPDPGSFHRLTPPPPKASTLALSPVTLPPAWGVPADSGDFSKLYDILQNEHFTMTLWNARVCNLATREWLDLKDIRAKNSLSIRKIARTDDRQTYQIDVEVRQRAAQWLEFASEWSDRKAACVLISDKHYFPCYSLLLDFIDGEMTALDVTLSASNVELLGWAATVWNKYRSADIETSASSKEFQLLEHALSEKTESPLAATMAALLLLRSWRPDLLHNWPRNLAKWFPDRPDGLVIWAEQLLRTEQDKKLKEAIDWLLELDHRGLPHTSEALGHAARQVIEMLEFAFPEPKRNDEQQRRYEGLKKLQKRLTRALSVFRPGGLCAVFVGTKDAVTPELILPA